MVLLALACAAVLIATAALAAAGIELIGEGAVSHAGGRGVRLKR